jgi:hypothetical protein
MPLCAYRRRAVTAMLYPQKRRGACMLPDSEIQDLVAGGRAFYKPG